ncbi:MAG: glycosyltransferase family 2 protein [Candidatus Zixiibacteriota bacterium]
MGRLSVIIITKNEELNLRRCLDSIRFADEIIINDTGSSDQTIAIACEYKCRVLENDFAGFGRAKQQALEAATCEWVLSIDADEVIDAELAESIRKAIDSKSANGCRFRRKSQFLGRWIMHSGWYPGYVMRLFRRECGRFNDNRVHESVILSGKAARIEGHMLHYTYPFSSLYIEKMNRYTSLYAEQMTQNGKRFSFWKLLVKPPIYFFKIYIIKQGFRDGLAGLILAVFSTFDVFARHVKLWELQRQ